MPQLSPNSVQLLNGKVVLSKRDRSPYWQARFRIGRRWIRTSTKCEELDEAEAAALEMHAEAKFKEKHDIPVVTRKFRSVATSVKERLQKAQESGQGRAAYRDYIQAIDNYLIPFFGNHNIDTVDAALLRAFEDYREKKLDRVPAKSTLNNHTAALNRIFDEAVQQGYVTKSQIPDTKFDRYRRKRVERRPDFALPEYKQLYRFMRSWINKGKKGKSTAMRYLLRDAVLFLANSGIRYGTEFYNLKWRNIELRDNYLVLTVNGKTGRREVIPRSNSKRYLERIQERAEDLKSLSFEEALKVDEYVFRLADGTRSLNLNQTFRKLMSDSGLGVCPRTDKMRTLYSFRHFYITQSLQNNRASLHTIAKNCGTSVTMLERHYSHLEVWAMRDELTR